MSKLKDTGFEYYNLYKMLHYSGIDEDLKELTEAFEHLPQDEYAPALNRYRRYARAIIMPGTYHMEWLPETVIDGNTYYEYFQGSFNPEYTGEYRRFPAIGERTRRNHLLEKIILFNFKQTFWTKEDALMPFHAGVHFVKLKAEKSGEKAVSSPNTLHQDGEPFTFAHLISRKNVKGGLNAISIPEHRGRLPEDIKEGGLTASFYLSSPLESYGIYDPLVTHYVGDVEKGEGDGPGERSAILIDYQPSVIADPDQVRSMRGNTKDMNFV
ncbi:2OG-Fe dioxygenase family protein [Alteribacillus sp. HJP-4]|uniref:2OG-Fe dioxygenase family protein n=1 Tax=Alteribacillus sp. HJP-4 TaxID=2775394 RepID=UPI0035CD22C9